MGAGWPPGKLDGAGPLRNEGATLFSEFSDPTLLELRAAVFCGAGSKLAELAEPELEPKLEVDPPAVLVEAPNEVLALLCVKIGPPLDRVLLEPAVEESSVSTNPGLEAAGTEFAERAL